MQKFIMSHKNQVTVTSGVLIILGLLSHFVLHNQWLLDSSFMLAALFGLAPILLQAVQSLKIRLITIDVLVTIAVIGAFFIQNYEEAAIVTFLFLLGSFLEQRTLNKTRSAIKSLVDLAPETAWRQSSNQTYEEIPVDDVMVDDVLLVKTGGKVPVDGQVIAGTGYLNEASITGEATLAKKSAEAKVFAGTILENGTIQIKAQRVGEDTTFSKIIELVEEAQDSKSEAERFIDRFSKYYTPGILLLAVIVFLLSRNLELTITILVLGCPGALVIGVPVSNVAGIGNGARNGLLLKGSEIIHTFSKTDTVIFDKTGTLTSGTPEVVEQIYYGENLEQDLQYLASLEAQSDHPLAKTILKKIGSTSLYPVQNTQVMKGHGIQAEVAGHLMTVGNPQLMKKNQISLTEQTQMDIASMEAQGYSLVLMALDQKLRILLGIRDQVRPNMKENLQKLTDSGVKNLVLLSGDNQGTVDLVAKELGLTQAYGNMLPKDKADFIKKEQELGHVVTFIGDGINDSPSLALADIGIAMGSGTEVAIETSDIVLINNDFSRIPHALSLAKATVANMKQNIILAVAVVVVLLSSVFLSSWMNMSIGMFVHESSILVVILNGMRLANYRKKEQKIDSNQFLKPKPIL